MTLFGRLRAATLQPSRFSSSADGIGFDIFKSVYGMYFVSDAEAVWSAWRR